MKQNEKNRGLRKALERKNSALPSNFIFCTMQRVEEYARQREKRREQLMLYSIITVSVLLLAGAGITIYLYCREEVKRMASDLTSAFLHFTSQASPYCYLAIIILVLILFDYWMRSSYYKQHKE